MLLLAQFINILQVDKIQGFFIRQGSQTKNLIHIQDNQTNKEDQSSQCLDIPLCCIRHQYVQSKTWKIYVQQFQFPPSLHKKNESSQLVQNHTKLNNNNLWLKIFISTNQKVNKTKRCKY
ncbi:unnamed protein product [Paramecium octaurelia]|uniref:Uncharacterized protein n=1 Tax=Paramecium octaurelia TaxID=43137 RepID=A0A8S1SUY9_PAROT|nr:unnamed protein product [Paramecium octaurelia]